MPDTRTKTPRQKMRCMSGAKKMTLNLWHDPLRRRQCRPRKLSRCQGLAFLHGLLIVLGLSDECWDARQDPTPFDPNPLADSALRALHAALTSHRAPEGSRQRSKCIARSAVLGP